MSCSYPGVLAAGVASWKHGLSGRVWQGFGGGIAVECTGWIKDWERWVVSQGKAPAFVYCRHESAHSLSAICNEA